MRGVPSVGARRSGAAGRRRRAPPRRRVPESLGERGEDLARRSARRRGSGRPGRTAPRRRGCPSASAAATAASAGRPRPARRGTSPLPRAIRSGRSPMRGCCASAPSTSSTVNGDAADSAARHELADRARTAAPSTSSAHQRGMSRHGRSTAIASSRRRELNSVERHRSPHPPILPSQQPPARIRPVDRLAGEQRRPHDPGELAAVVGRDRVPVLERLGIDREQLVGGEHDEVRRASLARSRPSRSGRRGGPAPRHPLDDPGERDAAPARLGPDERQSELHRGDAAPRLGEVAVARELQSTPARASGRRR